MCVFHNDGSPVIGTLSKTDIYSKKMPRGAGAKVYFILYLMKFKQVPPPAQHFFMI